MKTVFLDLVNHNSDVFSDHQIDNLLKAKSIDKFYEYQEKYDIATLIIAAESVDNNDYEHLADIRKLLQNVRTETPFINRVLMLRNVDFNSIIIAKNELRVQKIYQLDGEIPEEFFFFISESASQNSKEDI